MKIHASALNLAYHCPGAPKLLQSLPSHVDTGEAVRWGLVAHDYLAICWELGPDQATQWLRETEPEFATEMTETALWVAEQFPAWDAKQGVTETRFRVPLPEINSYISCRVDWANLHPGGATVVDWKHGAGQKYFLPDIMNDLQMGAYAVAIAAEWDVTNVTVIRALLTPQETHVLHYSPEALRLTRDALAAITHDCLRQADALQTGVWCNHCFARHICKARLEQAAESLSLIPADPAIVTLTDDQATLYALHRTALRERLDVLDEALQRYVVAGGRVEHDNKRLTLSRFSVDRIARPAEILAELMTTVGPYASSAMRTTKQAVTASLRAAGLSRDAIRDHLAIWREKGWITKEPRNALRWR